MDLAFRPAIDKDFDEFFYCCYPRDRHDDSLRAIVRHEWRTIIANQTTLSMLVVDKERPEGARIVACAQTAFVSEEFAHFLRQKQAPWVNVHATHPLPSGSWPLLDLRSVRDANSHDGLIGLITRWMVEDGGYQPEDALRLHDYLERRFVVFVRGYNLKEIFVESTGFLARDESIRAGFHILNDYTDYFRGELPPNYALPCLLHITREQAYLQKNSLVARAFAYRKPKYGFNFGVILQETLRWAIAGADDDELVVRLEIPRNTLNKRWKAIYQRVRERNPKLLPKRDANKSGRGEENRRILLRYLEDHPEELCPVDIKVLN